MAEDANESSEATPRLPSADDWVERLHAVGKAQERYLWILVVLAIFYGALHVRLTSPGAEADTPLTIPFIGLELEASVVRASGPFLLSFVLLAFFGALRAFGRASKVLGLNSPVVPPGSLEGLDIYPNALELAVYTTSDTPKKLRQFLYLTYPILMLAILLEAAWIGVAVVRTTPPPSGPGWFVLAAVPLWIGAAYQVAWLHFIGRLRKLGDKKF